MGGWVAVGGWEWVGAGGGGHGCGGVAMATDRCVARRVRFPCEVLGA